VPEPARFRRGSPPPRHPPAGGGAPQENPAYREAEKHAFREHPETMAQLRSDISRLLADTFSTAVVDVHSPQLEAIHAACVANLENGVRDPVLREKIRPDYRAGCKRLALSDDLYEAVERPNARLVTEGIEPIEPEGVRTGDGRREAVEVLVLATGLRVDRFVRPTQVIGYEGTPLDKVWKDDPFAYLPVSVPGPPNFFMLNGPRGPVGNSSLIDVAKLASVGHAARRAGPGPPLPGGECLPRGDASVRDRAGPGRPDHDLAERLQELVPRRRGVPRAWPWTFDRFRKEMAKPRLADFELR